jgi:hypothetical protein
MMSNPTVGARSGRGRPTLPRPGPVCWFQIWAGDLTT